MARIYSNENFPRQVVDELRILGHDVVTIQEAGMSGKGESDEDVLAYAWSQRRILLTLNRRHFVRLHQSSSEHSGIIVCSQDLDYSGQARRIHEAVRSHSDLSNKLLRIDRPSQAN